MALLKKYFGGAIQVMIQNNQLIVIGKFKPDVQSMEYVYRIEYRVCEKPNVSILEPYIEFNDKIHMYSDRTLCLYWPAEWTWNDSRRLYNTILPWIHGWIVFYELYLLTGLWLHPEKKHFNTK